MVMLKANNGKRKFASISAFAFTRRQLSCCNANR